ncbi:MAG: permease [Planctomycetota bacterium]
MSKIAVKKWEIDSPSVAVPSVVLWFLLNSGERSVIEAMWQMTVELAPWLVVGAAVAGAMHAFLPAGLMRRLLGGKGAVWKSVLVGVPLPLCSCAVIPVGLGLKRQGASDGAAVAFLIATPQTGVDSVLVTAGLLGWPLALFKVATALMTGLAGGWLTDSVTPKSMALPIIDPPRAPGDSTSLSFRVRSGAAHADDLIGAIWKWLVLGIVVSAAISTFAPPSMMEGLAAYGLAAAMGAALTLSLPLYVCATASVPIAAALVAAGLPLGAAIVFLMAGPATNAATIGAVYRGIGTRALAVYLGTIVVGSLVGGVLFEAWFGTATAADMNVIGHDHSHSANLVEILAAVGLIVWLASWAYRDLTKPASAGDGEHSH